MADVVTRLVVESKEYDSKIARATSGLTQFEKKCREVGGTLEFVEKEDLDFVKALGQMDTVASTATGKLGELKKAFTELSVQYKNLTDEEKKSPYGKALSASLDQLKGRIKNLQGDLNKAQSEMTGFGDAFKQIGAKMGIPMDMFTKFGPYVAAAGAALKVATDAFKQNELVMDEWGRTTESAGSVYQGFLNALNTGDISGFLRNIEKIISKARDAYDALDELNTYNAFNKIQVEEARTIFTEAVSSYREGNGSKKDVKEAANRLKQELQTRQKKEQDAYITAIKELAASRGVDEEMLRKALSGTYGDYEKLKNTPLTGIETQYHSAGQFGGVYTTEKKVAANEVEKLGEMLRKLNDDELGRIQQLGATAQATATEIANVDKQVTRVLGKGQITQPKPTAKPTNVAKTSTGETLPIVGSLGDWEAQAAAVQQYMKGAISTEEYKELEADLEFIISKMNELKGIKEDTFTPGSLNDLNQQLKEAQSILANLAPDTEEWAAALQDVADKTSAVTALQAKMGVAPAAKSQTKDANEMRAAFSAAASAVSTVGAALQQIDDPAAKIAGIVATAIANIALGFSQATASPATTVAGVFGWIAAATTGLATMVSTITAIKSVTKGYAEGGMVGGNSYSGDNIVARLNSGEGVLTAQGVENASNMADAIGGNAAGGSNYGSYVSGENIVIGVNNYLGRSGRGEIVTTSMLRRAGINL